MKRRTMWALLLALLLSSCAQGDLDLGEGTDRPKDVAGGCQPVETVVSSEKIDLLTRLAEKFNATDAARQGGCHAIRVRSFASGGAAQLLAEDWPDEEANGPKPVIWSPAGSTWGAIVNQRRAEANKQPIAPGDAKRFMLTPLVIAMPKPMADALGYPETPIGYADLLALSQDPDGWGSKGRPEWGAFKLGKTNPNFSTSALSATIAQHYAATGKVRDLSLEDVNRADVDAFNRKIESSVVHYGDITMTFLNNWFRNDARGTSLTYVSAVAIEEKSVIDYNAGNPDGVLEPGEQPRKPKVPLVAIYPKEGTLFSDNPIYVLDAPWVDAAERKVALAFSDFVQQPENQREVLKFGFRPGNPRVPVGKPIERANGVDPAQPETELGVPAPAVLTRLIDRWAEQRKSARVLIVLDVSGSMGDEAGDSGETKLELAKAATIRALSQFKSDDLVGLRVFTTNIQNKEPRDYLDLVPIGPIGENREIIASKIRNLTPIEGTPLYTAARASFEEIKANHDAARINAVLLLTDGKNEDPRNNDLEGTLKALRAGSEGQSLAPVRLFTIAYGRDADKAILKRLAEATNAAAYDATDPTTIDKVLTAVVSNF